MPRVWSPADFADFFPPSPSGSHVPSRAASLDSKEHELGNGHKSQDSRTDSYDSTITDFAAEEAADMVLEGGSPGSPVLCSPVESAIREGKAAWTRLREQLDAHTPSPPNASEEAARKLITNHEHVLRDVTNPAPVSQMQLQRVSTLLATYVDQALRETARRLLCQGDSRRTHALQYFEVHLDASLPDQATAWSQTSNFLCWRIQASEVERPGRAPDMSPGAASTMRATLQQLWMATYLVLRRKAAYDQSQASSSDGGSGGSGRSIATGGSAQWPLTYRPAAGF